MGCPLRDDGKCVAAPDMSPNTADQVKAGLDARVAIHNHWSNAAACIAFFAMIAYCVGHC